MTGTVPALDVRVFPDYNVAHEVAGSYAFDELIAEATAGDITIVAVQPLSSDPFVGFSSGSNIGVTGELLVTITGDLSLNERSGDIRIRNVVASRGNVALIAEGTGGSIYDLDTTEVTPLGTTAWVTGNSVTLSSFDGGGSAPPSTSSRSTRRTRRRGAVIALATNGVYLTETAGVLNLDQVLSRVSDIVLVAQAGSILEFVHDAQADIQGSNLDLIANGVGSSIGSDTNSIEILGGGTGQQPNDGFQIEQFAPAPGRLVAESQAGVYLIEMSGALEVLLVETPTGDIRLEVHDSILAGEDLTVLEAGGTTFLGTVVAHGRVVATTGNVTVSAGDNFALPTDTILQSGTAGGDTITISGGQLIGSARDLDPVGAIITILGDITSNTTDPAAVVIRGGSNLDYFDLINPDGIPAQTALFGEGGDDRFFIQSVPAAMTVDGGTGANRYYIASTAARSLFVTDGVFDDTGDDLPAPFTALVNGTLENITADLTINTGDGGNGGHRDAIYLSAAGSTTALTTGVVTSSQVTGLGNNGTISYTTTLAGGTSLLIKLSDQNDELLVTGAGPTTRVLIYAGDGDDTVNVGVAGSDLSDLSGIVAFFGEEGTADVLNVYGVATAPAAGDINPNQLTAIAVAGLGSGTNQLLSTHNSLFGAGYTVDDITDFDGTFLAVDLTVQNLDAFAARLQTALRDIDVFIKNSLSKVTTTALFGYEVGDEVVYRLNPGETAIAGLTSDTAYFVSAVDPTSITLVRSLDDLSTATDVQLADIGETNRVTIGLLDYDDTTTIDLSPTAGAIAFAGNEVIVDNTIVFADDHLLEAGQAVVYHTDGNNAPIGGLTDGTVYYVIIVEAGIKLAASPGDASLGTAVAITSPSSGTPDAFSSQTVMSFDPVTGVGGDEIKFAGEHGFVNGQAVVYQAANIANTGTTEEPVSEIRPVGGLANDRLYYVIVVDETTIKLADTFADATNATPVAIPLTAVVTAADLLTITRDVLTTERSFAQNQITSNRIVFAENPGFVEGQAVVYDRGVGSTALGGLSDDHVYFVKLVAGSPNVIELAATPGGATLVLTAVGDTSTDTLAPAASFDPSSASVRNNEITFVGDHSFADGETIVYRPGDGNTAVGGLISGQSYVVIRVDDNTIQLTNEAGGSPIGIGASRTATLVPVITAPLAALVAADLNRRIEGAGLYDSVLFADIALRPETELLVAQFADGNSGLNRLLLEDAFPDALPKLPSVVPDLPAAIYYAQRFINRDGDESIISSVETVNISLTGNDGEFQVDSTFGGETNIDAGTGANSTVTLGTSPTGLHPQTLGRVGFLDGTVTITADNIVLDDGGNDERTTGSFAGNLVTGILPGSVTFTGTPSATIKLGANDDTFYIPSTELGQTVRIETGGGYDTVYVGTTPDAESAGTLDNLNGTLTIDGGSVFTGLNTLFLNDQSETTGQTYVVTNDYNPGAANTSNTIDTTTISRGGTTVLEYTRQETVALSGGSGGNIIDIQGTHREQSTDGSASSTFTVNTGTGDDTVTFGAPSGGDYRMIGFQQDLEAPTFGGSTPSQRGIPVLVNTQGGDDSVSIQDTASTERTNLALTTNDFRDLFPEAPDARADSVDIFTAVFGDDALARPLTTAALSTDADRPVNISIRQTAAQALQVGGDNVLLRVSLGDVENTTWAFTPSTTTVVNNRIIFSAPTTFADGDLVVYHKGQGNDSIGLTDGQIYHVKLISSTTVELSTDAGGSSITLTAPPTPAAGDPAPLNDRLSPVGNVVQVTTGSYESDIVVNAGAGNDTFVVENGVRMNGHSLDLNGQNGDDTAYIDFNGVSVIDSGDLDDTLDDVDYSRDEADAGVPGRGTIEPDSYFVETRFDSASSRWQFRIVDDTGTALSVADLGDALGVTSAWQNIDDLPIVETPTDVQAQVSRFDSRRGLIVDFAGHYRATGAIIAGATRLELARDAAGTVSVATAKQGVLARTVTQVTFDDGDVTAGRELDPGTYYVQTRFDGATTAWQFRLVDGALGTAAVIADVNGGGFTAAWQTITNVATQADGSRIVATGTGLLLEFGPQYQGGDFAGGNAAELLLGVPDAAVSLTFDGGLDTTSGPAASAGVGDTLRLAGDGYATGGIYSPSSTVSGGGTVTISGNTLTFLDIEPLIVHGLPDFSMLNPDIAVALVIESAQLANVTRGELQLHSLIVDGQVTWTQKKLFTLPTPALDVREVGQSVAVSADGQTLVVGTGATAGGADAGNLADGFVIVYEWNGSAWAESARLQASDIRLGANLGGNFGSSVDIDGNHIIVGAPGDAPTTAPAFSFDPLLVNPTLNRIEISGGLPSVGQAVQYQQGDGNSSIGLIDGGIYYVRAVVSGGVELALTPGGAAVDLNGVTIAPSNDRLTRSNYGAVYLFERSGAGGVWQQQQKILAPTYTADLQFGSAVAINGNKALVGANGSSEVHFYNFLDDSWVYHVGFSGSSGYGRSVALAGDFGLVGDPNNNRVQVFSVSRDIVRSTTYLYPSEAQAGEQFGAAVAAVSTSTVNRIVVGAPDWDSPAGYAFQADPGYANQGRAFVFDRVGTAWKLMARLTAEGGLTQADAAGEARAGANFGAAVALDGSYVVVGAPGHTNGTSLNTGAAYVFYELTNGTVGQSSWTRSAGASGSGRLFKTQAAENDRFGTGVAVGAGRVTVGIPGYDETANNQRQNLGAIQAFTTGGGVPVPGTYFFGAERLTSDLGTAGSRYGRQTLYDAATRQLFVGASQDDAVYVYVNEGLHWRLEHTLTGPTDSEFGFDFAMSTRWLVIGAPGTANDTGAAYIYEKVFGSWNLATSQRKTITGTGRFGTSVDVNANRIAVGEPEAEVRYNTRGGGTNYIDLETPGDAVVFTLSGSTWVLERRLVPDNFDIPLSRIQLGTASIPNAGYAVLYKDSGGRGTRYRVPSGCCYEETMSSARIYASTYLKLIDDDFFGDSGTVEVWNYNYTGSYLINFTENNIKVPSGIVVKVNSSTYNAGQSLPNLRKRNDDFDEYRLSTLDVDNVGAGLRQTRTTVGVPTTGLSNIESPPGGVSTYSLLADGLWGTNVQFTSANTVHVMSPVHNLTGSYDLSTTSTSPYRSVPHAVRTEAAAGTGGPALGLRADGAPQDNLEATRGNMTIAGSPAASTTGRAYVTNVAGGPQVVLRPYKFNSTNNVDRTDFETSEVEFGRGPEVISDGFYLVGNTSPIDSNQYVYNFRQRGPAWSPGALTVAAPLSTAKLGAAVAIAGTTAILGAPDYGNHGTVFVFNQTPNSDPDRDPLWELQSQIEAPGFRTGDKFGASVAINGENLIVGAPGRDIGTNDNAGGAYILRRLSDGWILQAELRGTVVGQEAGTSVDIGAEYAAIGGPSTSTPGVHLFRKIGTEWSADKVITTPQAGNRFGSSVHLSDTTLFVGSPGHNSDTGAVHIYSLAPHPQNVDSNVTSNVDNPGRIDFTGGSVGDEFGASLDGSGRYIVVGAPGTANDTGAAYVFIRPIGSTGWIQTRLDYSNGAVAGDRFGTSIAIDGTQIIVGAPGRTRTTGSDGPHL